MVANTAEQSDGPKDTSESALTPPTVEELIPRMLRGCAHGDLHGRNILVGIVRDRALWPAVFDYEDMGNCILVAWDFAKLETELKMRAYADVFHAPQRPLTDDERFRENLALISRIQRFDTELNRQTETHHKLHNWPLVGHEAKAEDRLRAILIELRHMAYMHLGVNRGRPNE